MQGCSLEKKTIEQEGYQLPLANVVLSNIGVLDTVNKDAERLRYRVSCLITALDKRINEQLDEIIESQEYQSLYAGWLGLHYLCQQIQWSDRVKLKVLNVSWNLLAQDLDGNYEFDRSAFFSKIYSQEFDMPGGEPYGLLLGNYQVELENQSRDMDTLITLADVCAAAFVPFAAGLSAHVFGINHYSELDLPFDITRGFSRKSFTRWNQFRKSESSRFINLLLPRILLNSYRELNIAYSNKFFPKKINIWANPCYALGAVIAKSVSESGWFLHISGVAEKAEQAYGGLVPGIIAPSVSTDTQPIINQYVTELLLSDSQENELSLLGFTPLCHSKGNSFAIFNGQNSAKKLPETEEEEQLTGLLSYMLSICRFAHYIKIISRDKIGLLTTPKECQEYLEKWLLQYVASNTDLNPGMKARFPLSNGMISVTQKPGTYETYLCRLQLSPHLHVAQAAATMVLRLELSSHSKK